MPNPDGLLGGQALGIRREVVHTPGRARAHGLRIEDAHVCAVALAEVATSSEPEHLGRLTSQLANRVLEGHHLPFTHPRTQQVRGQGCIAELVDVRSGVRETQRHVVVREQVRHRIDVVVGDIRAEPGLEVFGDGQLAHHVEGAAPALACQIIDPTALQLGEHHRLRDFEGVPTWPHVGVLEVGGGAGTPVRIAVRGEARLTVALQ